MTPQHDGAVERVRECTCNPDDGAPRPCPQKYALSECRSAHLRGAVEEVREALEPEIRRAADGVYFRLLETVEEYLTDNATFNIQSRLDSAERERRAQWERADTAERALTEALAGSKLAGERLEKVEQNYDDLFREYALTLGAKKAAEAERDGYRGALRELDAVLDFSEPASDDKPWIFEDWTALNAAFEQARQALSREAGSGSLQSRPSDDLGSVACSAEPSLASPSYATGVCPAPGVVSPEEKG